MGWITIFSPEEPKIKKEKLEVFLNKTKDNQFYLTYSKNYWDTSHKRFDTLKEVYVFVDKLRKEQKYKKALINLIHD